MFRKIFNKDFFEDKLLIPDQSIRQSCDLIISVILEDKKFLNLTNNATRTVSGHYELPLPFKNGDNTAKQQISSPANTRALEKKKTFCK